VVTLRDLDVLVFAAERGREVPLAGVVHDGDDRGSVRDACGRASGPRPRCSPLEMAQKITVALGIVAAIGDLQRFQSRQQLVSYPSRARGHVQDVATTSAT
jgi:hypothetical protein